MAGRPGQRRCQPSRVVSDDATDVVDGCFRFAKSAAQNKKGAFAPLAKDVSRLREAFPALSYASRLC